jgi:hypothetical protein
MALFRRRRVAARAVESRTVELRHARRADNSAATGEAEPKRGNRMPAIKAPTMPTRCATQAAPVPCAAIESRFWLANFVSAQVGPFPGGIQCCGACSGGPLPAFSTGGRALCSAFREALIPVSRGPGQSHQNGCALSRPCIMCIIQPPPLSDFGVPY